MKFREISLVVLGVLLAIGVIGVISKKKLGNDNVVEEICEDIIENQTGLDVDLSPGEDPDAKGKV